MEHNREKELLTQEQRKQEAERRVSQQHEQLHRYLDDCLTVSSLCLLSLAEHMNMSIYAAGRLVKRTTGQSFRVYVTQKRLELAYEQLQTSGDTVSKIAHRVGFENPAYFSSVFKKHYGFTPNSVKESR